MPGTIVFPDDHLTASRFRHVFVFPRERIVDYLDNVLLVANLFNFAINSAEPREDHKDWLPAVAGKKMVDHPNSAARLVGSASHTGPARFDEILSKQRASRCELYLFPFAWDLDLPHPSP